MQKTWIRIVTTALTLTMMGLIFFFSTEGAVESDATSGILSRSILKVIRPDFEQLPEEERINLYNQVQTVVRKTAHFTEFMLLGLFLRCCLESWFGPGVPALGPIALGGGAAYAALDEWHHTLVDGRAYMAFETPQRAVTPGQSAVFYDGQVCLGGAIVEERD